MDFFFKVLLAYLLGSVVGSLVVGRLRGGVDIRKLGSGNPGSTNALRTQGLAFGIWVIVIDVIKGVLAAALIRPGGKVANIGVHGAPATLHLEELWIKNVTIRTGLVDTYSTPTLLRLAQGHQVDAGKFVTHHFRLDQFDEAYDVFARAGETGALKVVLTRV